MSLTSSGSRWPGALVIAGTFLIAAPAAAPAAGPDLAAQTGSILGTVADQQTSEPLTGATVSVADTEILVRTGWDGGFVIPEVPAGNLTLRVAHPGYSAVVEDVVVSPGEVAFVDARLLPMEAMLEELLVFGEPVRPIVRSRAHAETELRGDTEGDGSTAADLLAQRVPGLNLSPAGGEPGAGMRVRIRGHNSLTRSNDPAIFLDGIRINAPGGGSQSTTEALRMLQGMPASSVERIRVLRGPAAAAAHGADSANGIILIETRSGGPDGGI